MKTLTYYKPNDQNGKEFLIVGETALGVHLANMNTDTPTEVNGYVVKDASGIHITLYEAGDINSFPDISVPIVALDLVATEAALDSFILPNGYVKV